MNSNCMPNLHIIFTFIFVTLYLFSKITIEIRILYIQPNVSPLNYYTQWVLLIIDLLINIY